MKKHYLATIAVVGLLVCSCIPSVYPFYSERDVVFESRLIGEWRDDGDAKDAQVWRFEKLNEGKGYKLEVREKEGKEGEFSAHLFRLKDNYFLDIIPNNCDYATNQADMVAMSMFPGHLLLRVREMEPALKLSFCDMDWLEKYLKKNPRALAHHVEEKSIVLTASTRDLQRFVLRHLGEGELFGEADESSVLTRAENAAQ